VVSSATKNDPMLALLIHPNMGVLSALQNSFAARGVHSVVSRDMPTALLALSQHDFSVAVIHDRIIEAGDGWALGSIVRRLFPGAHIAVICGTKDVLALQSAINNRLDQVFDEKVAIEKIADAVIGKLGKSETEKVQ
jgi:DNA-binding NtrC family response regulator